MTVRRSIKSLKSYHKSHGFRPSRTLLAEFEAVIEIQDDDAKTINRRSKMRIRKPTITRQQSEENDLISNSSSVTTAAVRNFSTSTRKNFYRINNVTLSTIGSGRNVTNELPLEVIIAIAASVSLSLALLCFCCTVPSIRHKVILCRLGFAPRQPQRADQGRRIWPSAPTEHFPSPRMHQRNTLPSQNAEPTWLTGFNFAKMTAFVRYYTYRK